MNRLRRKARRQFWRHAAGFYSFRLIMEAHYLGARALWCADRWAILLVRTDEHAKALGKDHLREVKRREIEPGERRSG